MQKNGTVIIIHGYKSSPQDCWFPWLKKELEKRWYDVKIPKMPHPDHPKVSAWIKTIQHTVGNVSPTTYFVGHSLGTMAIIRYLETIQSKEKIGGAIFVAGRFMTRTTKSKVSEFFDKKINWKKVKNSANKFVGVYSLDDPLVSTENGRLIGQKLGAKFVLEKHKGHFSQDDKIFKLPVVLKELLLLSKKDKEDVSRET
jgi:predicted alpha/beta hydrolase family esterase